MTSLYKFVISYFSSFVRLILILCEQEYIYDNAAGNPKHIEEIVAQLRKEKAIEVANGRVQILVDSFDHV